MLPIRLEDPFWTTPPSKHTTAADSPEYGFSLLFVPGLKVNEPEVPKTCSYFSIRSLFWSGGTPEPRVFRTDGWSGYFTK